MASPLIPTYITLKTLFFSLAIGLAAAAGLTWLACRAHYSGCLMGFEIDSRVAHTLAEQKDNP